MKKMVIIMILALVLGSVFIYKEILSKKDHKMEEVSMTKNKLKNASIIKKTEAYTIYELSFRRGGKKIYGNLYVPSRDQKQYSLVIMAHGFGSSYSYLTEYASKLVKNGIAAYIFDFCGGSSYSRSDGEMTKMSILTEKKDLQTVFDSLKTESFVDQDHIFLMGESQGGLVASLVAAAAPKEVKGLALLYPAYVIPDDARKTYKDLSEVPDTYGIMGMTVGKIYYQDVYKMDVYQKIKDFKKNVLIIHGSADTIVPIAYSKKAIKVFKHAQLKVIKGAGHGFYGRDQEEAANDLVRFVKQNMA